MVKEYEEIMAEVTSGLTGDFEADGKYLLEKREEYMEHELGKEILRGLGRLFNSIMPDEMRAKFMEAYKKEENRFLAVEAIAEEANFNVYKKNWPRALELIESAARKVEEEFLAFADDAVSEYHYFRNFFEEVIYKELYKPTREVRRMPEDYALVYGLYGVILFELKRYEDAEVVLKKALRINPVRTDFLSELSEIYKLRQDWGNYVELSKRMLECAYTPDGVAKGLRNLGYYFIEQKDFETAVAMYAMSMNFEESQASNTELMYIQQLTGKQVEIPGFDEMKAIFEMHEIQMGVNEKVLGLAYALGRHFKEAGEKDLARFHFGVVYDLTKSEEVKGEIAKLGN